MLKLIIIMGIVSKSKVTSESEENMFITFIWSCTNFWFLRPTDKLLSFKSSKSHTIRYGSIELAVLAYFFGK